MNNIRVVDNIVQQTESLISKFYGDDDTSFIFTADHGMSVIGNHGDGSTCPDCLTFLSSTSSQTLTVRERPLSLGAKVFEDPFPTLHLPRMTRTLNRGVLAISIDVILNKPILQP